jgi:hypothetical protein
MMWTQSKHGVSISFSSPSAAQANIPADTSPPFFALTLVPCTPTVLPEPLVGCVSDLTSVLDRHTTAELLDLCHMYIVSVEVSSHGEFTESLMISIMKKRSESFQKLKDIVTQSETHINDLSKLYELTSLEISYLKDESQSYRMYCGEQWWRKSSSPSGKGSSSYLQESLLCQDPSGT